MDERKNSIQVMWVALIALMLVACGSTAVPPTPFPPIEVTFDGNECAISGLDVLPEGEYIFIFNDFDGKPGATFYVQRINEGKTYQDIIELQGGIPGKYYDMPNFITYAIKIDSETNISTGEMRTTYSLDKGEYYIDAFKGWNKAWLCGSFTVVSE